MTLRQAIATLLYSTDYLPGVFTLGYQLNKLLKDKKCFELCLVATRKLYGSELSDLSKKILKDLFDIIVIVDPLENQNSSMERNSVNLALLKRPELAFTLIKARLWELSQFDRILYIDGDTLPLKEDIVDVFDILPDQNSCQVAASPDIGWPDMFNSGVLMLVPDKKIARLLQSFILNHISIDGADQGILNQFFNPVCFIGGSAGTGYNSGEWVRLPFVYNVTMPNYGYQSSPATKYFRTQVKLVHFIGENKPWRGWTQSNVNGYFTQWNDVYKEFQAAYQLTECFESLSVVEKPKENHWTIPSYYQQEHIFFEGKKDCFDYKERQTMTRPTDIKGSSWWDEHSETNYIPNRKVNDGGNYEIPERRPSYSQFSQNYHNSNNELFEKSRSNTSNEYCSMLQHDNQDNRFSYQLDYEEGSNRGQVDTTQTTDAKSPVMTYGQYEESPERIFFEHISKPCEASKAANVRGELSPEKKTSTVADTLFIPELASLNGMETRRPSVPQANTSSAENDHNNKEMAKHPSINTIADSMFIPQLIPPSRNKREENMVPPQSRSHKTGCSSNKEFTGRTFPDRYSFQDKALSNMGEIAECVFPRKVSTQETILSDMGGMPVELSSFPSFDGEVISTNMEEPPERVFPKETQSPDLIPSNIGDVPERIFPSESSVHEVLPSHIHEAPERVFPKIDPQFDTPGNVDMNLKKAGESRLAAEALLQDTPPVDSAIEKTLASIREDTSRDTGVPHIFEWEDDDYLSKVERSFPN